MAKATLFSPITKERRAIDIGSPEEKQLFSQGFKLETPSQNLDTWDWNAPKQIATGDRGALFSSDATGTTPIANQGQLSQNVVSGGYQDTRRPIGFEGQWGPEAAGFTSGPVNDGTTGSGTMGTGNAGTGSATNNMSIAEQFNNAVSKLLLGLKEGNLDKDLLDQRNQLIQQRFNNTNEQTPAGEMNLTPQQQASLRSQRERSLETQLSGVNSALEARKTSRSEYKDILNITLDNIDKQMQYAKDDLEAQNDIRDDARTSLQFLLKENPDAVRDMSASEKAAWEKAAGYFPGTLAHYDTTLTESEKAANEKNKSPGSTSETVKKYADYLVKSFGGTVTQTPYSGTTHGKLNAYDVALKAGTSLNSPFANGIVVAIGNFPNRITTATGTEKDYGNYVDIKDNETGRVIRFGHLSRIDVGVGDSVGALDTFGLSGNSGLALGATGNHVHIEERQPGSFAEPPEPDKAPTETEKKQILLQEADQALASLTGENGKVAPENYRAARNAWLSYGYSADDFDEAFDKYIDKRYDDWKETHNIIKTLKIEQ